MLIGGLVFAAAMIVYGLGLLTRWDTTLADLDKFLAGGGTWHFTREGIDHALRFVTGMDFHAQYRELTLGSDALANVSVIIYACLTIVLVLGVGLAVRAIVQKRPERRAGIVLLIWYCVPIVLMTVDLASSSSVLFAAGCSGRACADGLGFSAVDPAAVRSSRRGDRVVQLRGGVRPEFALVQCQCGAAPDDA